MNPGNDNFKIACNSEIYVDKTEMMEQTNRMLNTQQRFICISRPRRFGKSMAAYYGKDCDSSELFAPYKIAETEVKPAESEKDEASTPVNAPVITKITVETYGVDYGLPETNDTFDYYSWLMKQYNNVCCEK